MKPFSVLAGLLLVVAIVYWISDQIHGYIDRKSGAIVEETLSDNTISQLSLLIDVQQLLKTGEVAQANLKLSESIETSIYILENNCSLPKCDKALRNYKAQLTHR
jgi:hypothetical protein